MSIIDALTAPLRARKGKATGAAEIAAEIAELRDRHAKASEAHRSAEAQRVAAVEAGDFAAAQKLKEPRDAARDLEADVGLALAKATERYDAAVAAEDEEARRAAHGAAREELESTDWLAEYTALAAGLARFTEKIERTNARIEAANADLPAGAARLPHVEDHAFGLPEVAERVVEQRDVTKWLYERTGNVVPEDGTVSDHGNGRGSFRSHSSSWGTPSPVVQRRLVERKIAGRLDAVRPRRFRDLIDLPRPFSSGSMRDHRGFNPARVPEMLVRPERTQPIRVEYLDPAGPNGPAEPAP